MKPREIKRLRQIHQALKKKISQKQAAEIAELSARQMRRLMKRVEAEGDRASCIGGRIASRLVGRATPEAGLKGPISMMPRIRSRPIFTIMRARIPALDSFGAGGSATGFPAVCIWTNTRRVDRLKPQRWRNSRRAGNNQSQFQRPMSELGVEVIHAHSRSPPICIAGHPHSWSSIRCSA